MHSQHHQLYPGLPGPRLPSTTTKCSFPRNLSQRAYMCLQNWSTMVNFMRWPTLKKLKMLTVDTPKELCSRAFEGLHQTWKLMWTVRAFFPTQWTLVFHWIIEDWCIGIQFESCKSLQKCVVQNDFHTSIHKKNGRRTKVWKVREKPMKTPWKWVKNPWF